jgi:Lipid A 3-O-deacylase (PagL).
MKLSRLLSGLFVVFTSLYLHSQESTGYSLRQSFSIFGEYSNDSSHIILGVTQNRRLAALGFTYSRRLFHTRYVDWNYAPELLPLVFIQDPIATITFSGNSITTSGEIAVPTTCKPATFIVPPDPASGFSDYTITQTCGTRWTYAGGLSPLGQRLNIATRHRLQPFLLGNAGFLLSTRDIPVDNSSRFNFTFEFGGGVEFFRDRHHSWAIEYRLHHLSNDYTGVTNPGIDNQIVKVTYSIGR